MTGPGRHSGRRVAERPARSGGPRVGGAPGIRGVVGGVLVVLVAAALVCAGTAGEPTGPHQPASRTAATGQDRSCLGRLPGSRAWVGSVRPSAGLTTVRGKPVQGRVELPVRSRPVRMHAGPGAAGWSYAVRSARAGNWAAAGACPTPRGEWWFVGAGASQRHAGTLLLDNPREGTAVVNIDVLGPDGPVKSPGLQGIQVRSRHAVRLELARVAPAVGDLAVHVEAVRGLVAASVTDRWTPAVVVKPSQEWLAPQPPARRALTLVGVLPKTPHAALLVSNPSEREAVVKLSFVNESGTFTPPRQGSVTVPPQSVRSVDLDDALKSAPLAVELHSQVPVAATLRSWAGSDTVYATAAAPLGRRAVAGVPGGLEAQLQLSSGRGAKGGSEAARFRVIGYGARGQVVGHRTVELPAASADRVDLWSATTAVQVRRVGARPGFRVRGALLVHHGRGHYGAIPLASAAAATHVPVIRPGW